MRASWKLKPFYGYRGCTRKRPMSDDFWKPWCTLYFFLGKDIWFWMQALSDELFLLFLLFLSFHPQLSISLTFLLSYCLLSVCTVAVLRSSGRKWSSWPVGWFYFRLSWHESQMLLIYCRGYLLTTFREHFLYSHVYCHMYSYRLVWNCLIKAF